MLTLRDWYALNAVVGDTERYRRHSKLEAYYWGIQYDHLTYEWSDEEYPSGHALAGEPIPIRSKRPKSKYNLAKRSVNDTVSLLVGEGRYPSISVDDTPEATQALAALEGHTKLPNIAANVARMMVTTGSVALGLRAVRRERALVWDVLQAKHCAPTFGDDDPDAAFAYDLGPHDLTHLRVQYAYPVEVKAAGGTSTERQWILFRRDYTPEAVIEYAREVIKQDPQGNVTSIPDPEETGRWTHGLRRVPAVWIRSEVIEDDIDGSGLFEQVLEDLDDINYGRSLWSDAVDYNVNPIRVFEGLANEHFPAVQQQLRTGKGNTVALPPSFDGRAAVLKFVEMAGASVQAGAEKVKTLRAQALEVMRVVIQQHDEAVGAQSGVALDLLYRPMLSLIGEYRVGLGEGLRQAAILLLEAGIRLRSKLAIRDLPTYIYDPEWVMVDWPPVFPPTPADLQAEATTAVTLVGAGLMSQETATERTAARLSIDDVEQEKRRIKGERDAMLGEMMHGDPNSDGDPNADPNADPSGTDDIKAKKAKKGSNAKP